MKIVDYRPLLVRRFARPEHQPTPPGFLGGWVGSLVDGILTHRVSGRPRAGAGPLLVSVGNLALGGTGKTPVVMALARDLAASGIKGAVLTRGYGSSLVGPLIVQPQNHMAGDEARMMADRLADLSWPVIQARNRPLGLDFIRHLPAQPELILLEDAHQTGGLARHLDLLILDSWHICRENGEDLLEPVTGPVFPLGPWRETARGSKRASALIIEGGPCPPVKSRSGQPVFSFSRSVELRQVQGQVKEEDEQRWALVSGIARPHRFEASAHQCLNQPIVLSLRCRDHAVYSNNLLVKILREMDSTGATALVTTVKDWIKLATLWRDPRPVLVLDMDLVWEKSNALNQWLVERLENSGQIVD